MNSTEKNKQIVREFYDLAINKKDYASIADKYIGDLYIQHNPLVEDGPEGFKKFIEFLKTDYPDAHSEIKRIFADGDFVILHVHSFRQSNTRGRAIIEIFRVDNGKVVEHWDTIQGIPETSANPNTMF
ncbi:MAG TPA: ester cyclase [Petrimonas sp.]|nr:ester cyclase [Petrimonas sp.]